MCLAVVVIAAEAGVEIVGEVALVESEWREGLFDLGVSAPLMRVFLTSSATYSLGTMGCMWSSKPTTPLLSMDYELVSNEGRDGVGVKYLGAVRFADPVDCHWLQVDVDENEVNVVVIAMKFVKSSNISQFISFMLTTLA